MNNFSGQIIAKGAGVWQVRFYLGKDNSGKRLTKSYTVHGTVKDVERFKVRFWDDYEAGKINRKRYTFAELWAEYFSQKSMSPKTEKPQETAYRLYISPYFNRCEVEKITPADVAKWVFELKKRGLAPSTINSTIGLLKAFFTWAYDLEIIEKNPAAKVKKIPNLRQGNDPLNTQEMQELLRVCKSDPSLLVVAFGLVSGMRPEEYSCLTWEDINFKSGFVTVSKVACYQDGVRTIRKGAKNAYSLRSVCISKDILEILKGLRKNSSSCYVFESKDGNYISHSTLTIRFKKALRLAGIERKLRLYDLRHSCATFLACSGRPIKDVATFLGHSSPNTTLKFYTHAQRSQSIACAEAFFSLQAHTRSAFEGDQAGDIYTILKAPVPMVS